MRSNCEHVRYHHTTWVTIPGESFLRCLSKFLTIDTESELCVWNETQHARDFLFMLINTCEHLWDLCVKIFENQLPWKFSSRSTFRKAIYLNIICTKDLCHVFCMLFFSIFFVRSTVVENCRFSGGSHGLDTCCGPCAVDSFTGRRPMVLPCNNQVAPGKLTYIENGHL